jgi:hypothetical protein
MAVPGGQLKKVGPEQFYLLEMFHVHLISAEGILILNLGMDFLIPHRHI